jgi:Flp pilus assembly protein TadG
MLLVLLKSVRPAIAHRRGAVAMEYAIIAPLLFTMILGIVEYGFVFYGYSSVQLAANQTARDIAVNTHNIANAEADLNAKLPPWIGPSEVTVVRTNPGDLDHSDIVVTATTDAGAATPIKLFTSVLPMELTTSVTVKGELPFDNETVPGGNNGRGGDDRNDGDDRNKGNGNG